MYRVDLIGGLGLMAFGLLLIFVIIPMETEAGTYYGLAPTFFPTVMAVGLTACAGGLTFQSWMRIRSAEAPEDSGAPITRWNLLMFLAASVIAIGCVLVIDHAGMLIGGPLLIAAFMIFLGDRNVIRIALTATVPVAAVYGLALHVLHAPLP